MVRSFFTVFFFLVPLTNVLSQIFPAEGSKLNYRIIGFRFPAIEKANHYEIVIAQGNFNNEDSFNTRIIQSVENGGSRAICEVPFFGQNYTWRVIASIGHSGIEKSKFYHFSTLTSPFVDSTKTRLRILKNADKFKDAYVFLDGSETLYDMNGRPVWFLPDVDNKHSEYHHIRDIKVTPQGSITFLLTNKAYEIDYKGGVLWQGPNNKNENQDARKFYRNEFTRLVNGDYMIMGNELLGYKLPSFSSGDSGAVIVPAADKPQSGSPFKHTIFGTLIEYDKNGNVVWSWKTSDYFKKSDLAYCTDPTNRERFDLHENSFYFDEKNSVIYVSYRNISRIIKLKYPEGNVLNNYGQLCKPHVLAPTNELFCFQHCCRASQRNYLYLYNNNCCHPDANPKITVMQQPTSPGDSLKLVWEYECTVDSVDRPEQKRPALTSGGSVYELPDSSMLACMDNYYSKVFIVNMHKDILWSALPEKWNDEKKKWDVIEQYRASIILNPEELERLIWGPDAQQ